MWSIVSIDNQLGIQLQPAGETERSIAVLRDSHFYGETEAEDCPGVDYHDCYCEDKVGFLSFSGRTKGKKMHETSNSHMPLYKSLSYSTWAAETFITQNTFNDFTTATTACGRQQRIFAVSEYESDFVPVQYFEYTSFNSVH